MTLSLRRSEGGRSAADRSRGQALVEMAIILPVLVLIVLFAVDFGRVFFGWVALHNMARVGANYAALHSDAWGSPGDAAIQDDYRNRMLQDAEAINCTLSDPLPDPTWIDVQGTSDPREVGDYASVSLSCDFDLITPLIGDLLGEPVSLSAEAVFPIRQGVIAGAPVQVILPPPVFTPNPTPTPPPCTVPQFVGDANDTSALNAKWDAAGFTGTLTRSPDNNSWSTVEAQSLPEDSEQPCTSGITVFATLPTPSPTPSPTPTPIPQCIVPQFIGDAKNVNALKDKWQAEGFSRNNLFVQGGNYATIGSQSLNEGATGPCATTQITVGP